MTMTIRCFLEPYVTHVKVSLFLHHVTENALMPLVIRKAIYTDDSHKVNQIYRYYISFTIQPQFTPPTIT